MSVCVCSDIFKADSTCILIENLSYLSAWIVRNITFNIYNILKKIWGRIIKH